MDEKKIKVTDKRLFTADGELKSEFRHLEDEDSPAPTPVPEPTLDEPEPPRVEEPVSQPDEAQAPPTDQSLGSPTFFDLVGVVAQPIALYLGDARMPEGESMENLELARLYIDLLEILEQKTEGNLTSEEKGFVTDLLYQLRLRYVEKKG